jgi:predicted nucleic acid-binding protein
MVVVADTSPINYLILIDAIDVLPALYGQVLVPPAVAVELGHDDAPEKVRQWMASPPAWLEVQMGSPEGIPRLMGLDPGEREAISLALERGVSLILMDETKGRSEAQSLRLTVRGTLGILVHAAKTGRIEFMPALKRLEATSFRMSPRVRAAAIRRFQS